MATWIVVGVVAALLVIGWAYHTANRLDRLNVRVDLARQALESTLDRRSVVVRAVAAEMIAGAPDGGYRKSDDDEVAVSARALMTLADRAERAAPSDREDAENALSAALARTDSRRRSPALVVELADAETRVMMARRFYNDAVRDTRALAQRRPVRWLRLGGHASPPEYFEIIERVTPGQAD
ncbi:LemA family protein [Gordonia sp. 'Campus']|uniref:LemA family protein n=1 Tax=Gordonia sp. 'Campus' TaxID=2915824 RepID=UPI001EE441FA|nr:LemA family protein [Gordonia sp. 'Campus']